MTWWRKARAVLAAALVGGLVASAPASADSAPSGPQVSSGTVSVAAMATATCAAQQFWDVPVSDPFCSQVSWLASTGVTAGYADAGHSAPGFHPTAAVSRQAMAAFLFRYGFSGRPDPACAGSVRMFKDVPAGGFCGAIEWLAGAGATAGYADHGFHPTAAVSRQAMAAFLYRFAHPGKSAPACTSQKFWDVPISDPFCPQISWLAAAKVTTGYTDAGKSLPGFHPTAPVSRQVMATFLFRADESGLIPRNGATPLPSVTSVSPATGSTAGGTVVTVTGTNLSGATKVLFDGPNTATPAAGSAVTVISSTRLTVKAPPHAAGAVPIRVVTAAGTSVPGTATFSYAVPAPDFGIPVTVGNATQLLVVRASSSSATVGTLTAWQRGGNGVWTRTLGPITAHLGAEGIGTASEYAERTPKGTFTLTQAFGIKSNPGTALPYFRATTSDWWVSDTDSSRYNTHQVCAPGTCPFDESAGEDLGTVAPQYDYAVVMDVNRNPVVRGGGSAFFLHVTDGGPTAGCVSIDQSSLLTIMRWLDPSAHPRIAIGVG